MRRRALSVFVFTAAALVMGGGVALAANISCPTQPGTNVCVGTQNADTMRGKANGDDMTGRGGGGSRRAARWPTSRTPAEAGYSVFRHREALTSRT
jgi:hypothetical protein